MKKILSCVMALSIAACAAMSASAATINEGTAQTGTKQITLSQDESYTVEIPEATAVALTAGEDVSIGTAEVTAATLNEGHAINVAVSAADNEWTMDLTGSSASTELGYTVKAGGSAVNSGDSIIENATEAAPEVELTVNANTPTVAGTYNDTLTFTVTVA